jgi:tRNA-uridine 2-sulfurtransferase
MLINKKKKVFVGLSGGVDSSVSCALLKEQGFDVTGVFIKIWHPELSNCDWKSEMRDAMRVCAHLDISFEMIDLSKEYFEEVIKYLINEYKEGKTPNPDVMCNKIIKFGHFFDWVMKNGADYVATGHYAQISNSRRPESSNCHSEFISESQKSEILRQFQDDKYLCKAKDEYKDQTYFLWNIKKEALEKTFFPIGNYTKDEVRNLAKKFNLSVSEKKDSQGLCFIGNLNLKEFLKKHLKTKKGKVLNENGEKIGVHDGAELYTIGERHGFKINNKIDNQVPHYVVSKDLKKNTITVVEKYIGQNLKIKTLTLKNINLLVDGDKFKEAKKVQVLVRYNGKFLDAHLEKNKVIFLEEQELVAIGQSVVFYDEDFCLGGGVVEKTE